MSAGDAAQPPVTWDWRKVGRMWPWLLTQLAGNSWLFEAKHGQALFRYLNPSGDRPVTSYSWNSQNSSGHLSRQHAGCGFDPNRGEPWERPPPRALLSSFPGPSVTGPESPLGNWGGAAGSLPLTTPHPTPHHPTPSVAGILSEHWYSQTWP